MGCIIILLLYHPVILANSVAAMFVASRHFDSQPLNLDNQCSIVLKDHFIYIIDEQMV